MYKFYAFISYNHRDAHVAQWLHGRLENYRIPSEINKSIINGNKFLRPVFRDKDDLGAGVLSEALREKLEESKFLIVICSQSSAQSDWVSKEVQSFIDLGRYANIIPLMIGEGQNCFPKSLRDYTSLNPEQELLGVSIPEVGKDKAFIRIVSKMLGVSFDSLWKRDVRQRKRKKMTIFTISALFILLSSLVAYSTISLKLKTLAEEYNNTVALIHSDLDSGHITSAEKNLSLINQRYVATEQVRDLKEKVVEIKSHYFYPAYSFDNRPADISEDGKYLSLASGNSLQILSIPSFLKERTIVTPGDSIYYAAFSRDSKSIITVSHKYIEEERSPYVILRSYGYIQVWDVQKAEAVKTVETAFGNPNNGMVITTDSSNRYLAIIDGQKTRYYMAPGENLDAWEESLNIMAKDRLSVWDLDKGEEIISKPLNGEVTVKPFFYNQAGKTVLMLKYQSHVDASQRIGTMALQGGQLTVVDDDSYTELAGTDADGYSVYNPWRWQPGLLINMDSGDRIQFIPGQPISSLKANSDASVLLSDRNVWLRNSDGVTASTNGIVVSSISFSRTGHMIAFQSNGACCIFNPMEETIIDTLFVRGTFQLCGDSELLVYDGERETKDVISILDLRTREAISSFTPSGFVEDDYPLFHSSVSDDLRYCAVLGGSGKLCIYDTRGGALLYTEPSFARSARNDSELKYIVDFIPGTHILSVVGTYIQLYDIDKCSFISRIGKVSYDDGSLPHLQIVSPDGKWLLVDHYSYTSIFDLASGRLVRTIQHSDLLQLDGHISCCFNSNSSMALLSSPHICAILIDLKKGEQVKVIENEDLESAFFRDNIPYVMTKGQIIRM